MTAQPKNPLKERLDKDARKIFATGVHVLVRLALEQRWSDAAKGWNTAGFISGYRGSPLATYDRELWRAEKALNAEQIVFKPAINEDLGATAVWGSQQAELGDEGKYEGVFGIWYSKVPGVDRSGDALRHGNLSGASAKGGVLLLLGDDHTSESSSTANQSEYAMMDYSIPVFSPTSVSEFLEYGLYAIALSRFAGVWTSMKCLHDLVESSESFDVPSARPDIRLPDIELPPGGLSIRRGDTPLQQEQRLYLHKLPAVAAFARVNRLNRTIFQAETTRLGIVASGKAYRDVVHALGLLGLDEASAAAQGISLFKVGLPYPLETTELQEFCTAAETVLVVEEKRPLIEDQLRNYLYGQREAPCLIGKTDETGQPLLPVHGILTPGQVATVIAARLGGAEPTRQPEFRLPDAGGARNEPFEVRLPHFCAGCPHNTSTNVPDGSRAMAGTGCSYMVQWMDRRTNGYTHMGADGVTWVGEAPFSKCDHIFQNMGDGTYQHSGVLAIRQSVAAKSNITYKILYNDAVAMTGGQPHDGPLAVGDVARQVLAEGAVRVVVTTDEPEKYPAGHLPPSVRVAHRDDLDAVQREMREVKGVSVLIYDQTCAAEKRRRRKRGTFPDPAKRTFINDLVCEGCGDCGVVSNCVAVVPKETAFGRKRAIDQTMCNKDFSCVKGFCPSFVTVEGGKLKRAEARVIDFDALGAGLSMPVVEDTGRPKGIVVAGIGGTGVLTVSAVLGVAAHIEGRGCSVLDMTGLAQKGGAVASYVWIGDAGKMTVTPRVGAGECDGLIACDLMVAAGELCLPTLASRRTGAVLNAHETQTGTFTRDPDFRIDTRLIEPRLRRHTDAARTTTLDANQLAATAFGSTETANIIMLGAAFQQGLVSLGEAAIIEAIRLNGVKVQENVNAFILGRAVVGNPEAVKAALSGNDDPADEKAETLDQMIARREAFLTDYQNARYAGRYQALVSRVAEAEKGVSGQPGPLTEAVARYYFKLLAYKDEYEVARLHTDTGFVQRIRDQFDGDVQVKFHLAPPMLAKKDPVTGLARKAQYGGYMFHAFRMLARLRFLRGTVLDPFARQADRKLERQLIRDYEATVEHVLERLPHASIEIATELLSIPEQIRGYGHVKERNVEKARKLEQGLRARLEKRSTLKSTSA